MIGVEIAACVNINALEYTLCIYHGHLFRRLPNGHICKADSSDESFYSKWYHSPFIGGAY